MKVLVGKYCCFSIAIAFVALHVLLLGSTGEAAVKVPGNLTIPAVIVFGDSIVDQGNNNHLKTITKCNFPPYGKDFLGGIPTGRYCNGKTPSDLIASAFGVKEYLPAYLDPNLQANDIVTGVSFASGGTGFDPQTPQIVSVLSLSDQVELFKEYIGKLKGIVGEESANNILANSLYVVLVGSDDIANTYFAVGIRRLHYDINSYTDLLIQYASKFLQDIYNLGARRIAVHSIPPVGCVPSQRTLAGGIGRGCAENINQAAQLFNAKLSSAVPALSSRLNARMFYADVYGPLLDLILNYEKYGFKVADKGCCGTGTIEVIVLCNKFSKTCPDDSAYLFWDSYHPTERGYKILVNKILQTYIDNLV